MELKSDVMFVRLTTGEDLVSEVTEVRDESGNEHYYILNNPMKVLYLSGGKAGYMSVSLMQWVFHRICREQTFNIFPNDVLTIGYPTDKMVNYYWNCVDEAYSRLEENAKKTNYGYKEEEEPVEELTEEEQMTEDNEALDALRELMETINAKAVKRTLH
jgi:hypothetical protein